MREEKKQRSTKVIHVKIINYLISSIIDNKSTVNFKQSKTFQTSSPFCSENKQKVAESAFPTWMSYLVCHLHIEIIYILHSDYTSALSLRRIYIEKY